MRVSLNHGSGPLIEAAEQNAIDNMGAFTADLRERGIDVDTFIRRSGADYGDGRYAFSVVTADGTSVEVQMPGLPLEQVRWLKADGQDIWQFPRLYVNDASWVWYFALDQFEDDDKPRRWPNGTVHGGELVVFSSSSAEESA